MKPIFWTGVVVAAISFTAFLMLVVPVIGHDVSFAALASGESGDNANRLQMWSVTTIALGLAVGSGLIGVGVGHWTHPRPSQTDGSPEV